jgi:hypothetical protein
MPVTNVQSKWVDGNLIFYDDSKELLKFDAVNHKVELQQGTAAGAGLSPLIWSTCPRAEMLLDPTLGIWVGDDFPIVQATGFPYTLYTDTTDTFTSLAGQIGGVGRIALSGSDNDEEYVVYNQSAGIIKADATHNWWFEARIKPSQVATAHGIFIGLAEEAGVGADLMNTDDMVLKVIDAIGFQIISAANGAACAVIQTIIQLNGGARVAVSATAGTATAAYIKFGMKSILGTVTFYLNGVALDDTVASTATNFPLDQIMCPTFGVKIGSDAAENLDIDWWYAAQLR